jgi:hypothetical protein
MAPFKLLMDFNPCLNSECVCPKDKTLFTGKRFQKDSVFGFPIGPKQTNHSKYI